LKAELRGLYTSKHFKAKSLGDIHSFLISNGLHNGLQDLPKLCELNMTIPATSSPVEHSFSALKTTKTFQRNSQGQECLSTLAMMSIEDLHLEMKADIAFIDKVTEEFCKKTQRIELCLR
jgi:hypothetical protein